MGNYGFCNDLSIKDFTSSELAVRQIKDINSVKIYRNGLVSVIEFVRSRPDLFLKDQNKDPHILIKEARAEAVMTWKGLLDYYIALDSISGLHKDFMKISNKGKRVISFHISRAALLSQYRFAMDFIQLTENNPALDTLFNEAAPDLGLPEGMYAEFKYRFLNVILAGEFAAYESIAKYYGSSEDAELNAFMEEDSKNIWDAGKGKGPQLTLKNGLKIISKTGSKAFFPVQKGISNWMGETKVYRKGKYLIRKSQIKKFEQLLKPGDILLERREWYLTNVGIPGFWSHAALYIGSGSERDAYLKDPDTLNWIQKQGAENFEELLKKTYPDAYENLSTPGKNGCTPRVIEAISKGVVFTTLEYSASCDSLAVLRPRLSKKEKAIAIFNSFQYSGRPYDYNFDFLTDSSLVCSELVYKAYEPGSDTTGLQLPLVKVMGHMVTPVNAFAQQYTKHYGKDSQQMDLILFMDGYERKKKAIRSDSKTFLKSCERPKWHIITQELKRK